MALQQHSAHEKCPTRASPPAEPHKIHLANPTHRAHHRIHPRPDPCLSSPEVGCPPRKEGLWGALGRWCLGPIHHSFRQCIPRAHPKPPHLLKSLGKCVPAFSQWLIAHHNAPSPSASHPAHPHKEAVAPTTPQARNPSASHPNPPHDHPTHKNAHFEHEAAHPSKKATVPCGRLICNRI